LNDGFVGIFGLAIGLGVVSGGHVEGGAGEFGEGSPKIGSEPGIAIRDDGGRPTMESVDMVVENARESF
jgi:hypothetical protein